MPRDALVEILRREFTETKVAHGLSADGTLLEVFASREGTFTLVKSYPSRISCMIDAGVNWQIDRSGTLARDAETSGGQ